MALYISQCQLQTTCSKCAETSLRAAPCALQMYGGSNHLRPPRAGESALKYFTRCTDETYIHNQGVKSIVQPRYTIGHGGDPHHFKYVEGRHAVASNLDKVRSSQSVYSYDLC